MTTLPTAPTESESFLLFPVLIFYYSETKMRSLEEIDLIFTKGYLEHMSYVTATKVLPFLAHLKVWALRQDGRVQARRYEAGSSISLYYYYTTIRNL